MPRRHHSRSPLRRDISYSSRPRSSHAINMLDADAVEMAKNESSLSSLSRKAGHITCTISGNRGDVRNRLTGGNFDGDRRVSMRGSIIKPTVTPINRRERRAAVLDRISYSNGSHRDRRNRDEDDDEDDRRNGSFKDSEKPVQRLIDPTFVPKSRNFFDHDDRMKTEAWKGRTVYDPRKDFGSRPNRRHSDWEGFGDRGRNRYDRREDRGRRDTYSDRRGEDFRSAAARSGADGLWTHDKFMELDDDSEMRNDEMEIVIDDRKSTRRVE